MKNYPLYRSMLRWIVGIFNCCYRGEHSWPITKRGNDGRKHCTVICEVCMREIEFDKEQWTAKLWP
jgi:hypothetical protein